MKHAEVLKAGSVVVTPFVVDDFIAAKEKVVTMESITKKQVCQAAQELGIACDTSDVAFAKKIIRYFADKK